MGIEDAMDISVSALNANRIKMEVVASNLANIDSTRTVDGGPYRRKIAVLGEKPLSFSEELEKAESRQGFGGGVEVIAVLDDKTPFQKVFNPGHPDADENGFVALPNVSMSKEMVDMAYIERIYGANVSVYNISKKMVVDTLQIQ